jgi:hypothetical protein
MKSTENLWDEQLLWTKSQSYMETALKQDRQSWLFPFWATLALELLARSALSYVSPTLLASTKKEGDADWTHLVYSLGFVPKVNNYKPRSIDASDLFVRCEQVIENFNGEHRTFCKGTLGLRNEELHSGGAPFINLPKDWLPRLYDCCSVLLQSVGSTLEDFVGPEEASAAAEMIKAMNDNAAKAVMGDIDAARKSWESLPEEERDKLAQAGALGSAPSKGHVVACPACKSSSLLLGQEITALPTEIEDDEIVMRAVVLPTNFNCLACGLTIKGHNRLHAAGLGGTFTRTTRFDPVEYYANAEPDYDEDFNE